MKKISQFVFVGLGITLLGVVTPVLAATPSLSLGSISTNSLSFSWSTADVANEANELRYSTSPITESNFGSATVAMSSDTISTPTMSKTISGLNSGTTYYVGYKYYSIKGAGEKVATVSATTKTISTPVPPGGGGGGGGTYYYPKTFNIAKVLINNDDATTLSTNVVLSFETDPVANEMSISNNINDVGTRWMLYATTTPWVLEPGDGIKAVYVKFRHAAKGYSDVVTDTIQLVSPSMIISTPPVYIPISYNPIIATPKAPQTFNILDFNVMMTNWEEKNSVVSASDLNNDTKVDFLDVLSLFNNWVDINIF